MTVNRLLLPAAAALYVIVAVARGSAAPAGPLDAPALTPIPAVRSAAPPGLGDGSAGQAQAPQTGYAGQDICVTCHEGYDTTINATKHGYARHPRTPAAAQGCETCHGPGEAHTQDPENVKLRQFDRLAATAVTDSCTTCHDRGSHALWAGSQHESRNVSCVTCHSVHSPRSEVAQLKAADQLKLCVNCHRDKVAKLDKSGHMPVREGKMECTSCHNPHGSTNVRLLKAGNSINESCASCHAEKRGPYLFEHAGVSGDSCATCHDPHGSSNDRMLVAKLPFLCQRCHNHTRHPSTIYDNRVTATSNRLYSRSCVSCHSAIHGSNHPAGSTFLRQ
jgi:DmsE family decaheme c-type cytochrome